MPKLSAFQPRLVFIDSSLEGKPSANRLEDLNRYAAWGFDGLVIDQESDLDDLLKASKTAGLQLFMQLSFDAPSPDSLLAREHPDWIDQSPIDRADDLPDPRKTSTSETRLFLRLTDSGTESKASAWWVKRLSEWVARGVAGFAVRLDGPGSPEFHSQILQSVRKAHPGCRFIAWTIAVSAERVASASTSEFDAAIASTGWWDFRSPWLAEEADRLASMNYVIATAGRPGQSVAPSELALAEPLLWVAAATGDGLLASASLLDAIDAKAVERALSSVKQAGVLGTSRRSWAMLSPPGSEIAVMLTHGLPANDAWMLAMNTSGSQRSIDAGALLARMDGLGMNGRLIHGDKEVLSSAREGEITLPPHHLWIHTVKPQKKRPPSVKESKRSIESSAKAAAKLPRIAIEAIAPSVDAGRFRTKRCVGERFVVEADVFGEGHDRIAAALLWRSQGDPLWHEARMRKLVNDRWQAAFLLSHVGSFEYAVEAWIDVFGAYRDEVEKKFSAGQDVGLELREGVLQLHSAVERARENGQEEIAEQMTALLAKIEIQPDQAARVAYVLSSDLARLMDELDPRVFAVRSAPGLIVDSERRAAGYSSWYELFPRSLGGDASQHGTFADVIDRLPAIQAMGFDTLYFPPIHPIGRKHRKGKNNSLEANESDPGSPYAIGSAEGGHDAIHHELGTIEDFRALNRAAKETGLEIALDFAIQCSPDHPWLQAHPDWFSWRPDGTIRYAENPPKKYQDIVNVDFYAGGAVPDLWIALRNIVLFWVKEGVTVFRVDNPHTKPMPFWEWLIADVRGRHPDAIFLAEAFTRPKPMYRLAKLGFSQSYTYFTWRNTKQEFIDYLTELTKESPRDFFRPHFFVNTPDINPYFLQRSGRAGFVIRTALATTLSGLWGMYSGFELCEAAPMPGKEEYLDSEKYELRPRNFSQAGNIVREITLLNRLRRHNPALQTHHGVRFCKSSGNEILCFTKTAPGNLLFIAICMDPHSPHECEFELPLEDWNVSEATVTRCEDLVHGHTFTLAGRHHRLKLDPTDLPFSIWRLTPAESA